MIYTFTEKEDFGETRVESTLPAKPQSVKTCHKPQLLHTSTNETFNLGRAVWQKRRK